MVNQVGGGGMAREAILAAMRAQQQASQQIASAGAGGLGAAEGLSSAGAVAPSAQPGSFVEALKDGLGEVQQQVQRTEALPENLVRGEVDEFHDVALAIKQSDLSFRFALQVRNKLIDAYREVMRMSV